MIARWQSCRGTASLTWTVNRLYTPFCTVKTDVFMFWNWLNKRTQINKETGKILLFAILLLLLRFSLSLTILGSKSIFWIIVNRSINVCKAGKIGSHDSNTFKVLIKSSLLDCKLIWDRNIPSQLDITFAPLLFLGVCFVQQMAFKLYTVILYNQHKITLFQLRNDFYFVIGFYTVEIKCKILTRVINLN